jgi:hypothetical protein
MQSQAKNLKKKKKIALGMQPKKIKRPCSIWIKKSVLNTKMLAYDHLIK